MKPRRGLVASLVPLVALSSCVRLRQVPPLPREAFAAHLTLESPPRNVTPGARFSVRLLVENVSPVAWPRTGWLSRGRTLSASYHWRATDGSPAVYDGIRTPLRTALAPGKSERLDLSVEAPGSPGAYVLEVDLVQEGVAWFADHGSEVARAPVRVGPRDVTPARS